MWGSDITEVFYTTAGSLGGQAAIAIASRSRAYEIVEADARGPKGRGMRP